jgi:pheromone shutdown protein TraB
MAGILNDIISLRGVSDPASQSKARVTGLFSLYFLLVSGAMTIFAALTPVKYQAVLFWVMLISAVLHAIVVFLVQTGRWQAGTALFSAYLMLIGLVVGGAGVQSNLVMI